ncbi:type-F conjugative transfer system mating-pair stabilisation protein TraN [Legionella busanensis]|uniref:Type-F conjugative transfer system mating-pair stabilisation protein TraN n=1 Tax=Legionella busanensis TaxID=190655 RepID=A0A378KHJ8_9GAMM|nr:conjugal transfer protein TraN [Legionella busanensis]STX81264.1 type-F conjugative transfer system mating-pair stabilisation protein TraN [Legionella busanensis]
MFKEIVILLLFVPLVFAGQTDTDYMDYKNRVQALRAQAFNAARGFEPSNTLKDYTENPEQKKYFQEVQAQHDHLPTIAQQELSKDRAGSTVYKHFADKPLVEINKNSEAIKKALLIEEQSHAIVNGQSNNEIHCEGKPKNCRQINEEEQCIYTNNNNEDKRFIGCEAQKERGCQQILSQCIKQSENHCVSFRQTYLCPKTHCDMQVVCAKNIFCADGGCVNTQESSNANMGKNVSALAAVSASGREYVEVREKSPGKNRPSPKPRQKPIKIFQGKAVSCKIYDWNFLDCCSDKGWGEKLNLAHCPHEDKALGEAKLAYRVHFLGKFCAKHWPKPIKGCKKWKNTYCVFDSKLSRIIHEEGRLKQLNANALGSAKYPLCDGLTVEELKLIDMGRIDFIEPVYPYLTGSPDKKAGIADDISLNAPNSDSLLSQTSERIKKRMEQNV